MDFFDNTSLQLPQNYTHSCTLQESGWKTASQSTKSQIICHRKAGYAEDTSPGLLTFTVHLLTFHPSLSLYSTNIFISILLVRKAQIKGTNYAYVLILRFNGHKGEEVTPEKQTVREA